MVRKSLSIIYRTYEQPCIFYMVATTKTFSRIVECQYFDTDPKSRLLPEQTLSVDYFLSIKTLTYSRHTRSKGLFDNEWTISFISYLSRRFCWLHLSIYKEFYSIHSRFRLTLLIYSNKFTVHDCLWENLAKTISGHFIKLKMYMSYLMNIKLNVPYSNQKCESNFGDPEC